MSKERPSDTAARVLSAAYLERASSKNDLLRRLRKIVEELEDDDVEPLSPDYPGLNGLAAALVDDKYLQHKDKEVRLHTVLACAEIFTVYAPEPPWDESEILKVFSQMIRQLGNLAHCTSPSQTNFSQYKSLLEQLAVVKIGVVLVELTKTLDADSQPTSDEALELLCDLIRTILQSVHIDHPQDVHNHAVSAVAACLDEFDTNIPIQVLDEILLCVSQGSVVYVTNPAAVEAAAKNAKNKKNKVENEKMPPLQIQQTNPSYMVAAAIIRRTVDRISTPMASFLNGLLNGDSNVVTKTSISTEEPSAVDASTKHADVWTIVYELHRIAPSILTTVIGTITNSLQAPQVEKRLRVTKLLGRLFYAPSSKIGVQFRLCFREWLRRANDCDVGVRLSMVKYLVSILNNKGNEQEMAQESAAVLVKMIEQDPDNTVRLQAIHQICDLAYRQKDTTEPLTGASSTSTTAAYIPARLLQAVGNRVSSKVKTERKDALTGLGQIYHKHYLVEKLKKVQMFGDDCSIDIILDTLQETSQSSGSKKRRRSSADEYASDDVDDKYSWIPRKVFESASFTDAIDPDMRNRVIQIVDDVLLGSTSEKNGGLTATSRAVGLAIILDSLRDDGDEICGVSSSNATNWMSILLTQRAHLQKSLGDYIDARTKLREFSPGTEESITADADAMEKLEVVASLTSSSAGEITPILQKLHNAKDNHIFRVLATITNPGHSSSARVRAFDELPKRTKSLGDLTASWVKTLARRCAMGFFLNGEIIHHSILLAQECFADGDLQGCMLFLSSVKTAAKIYPSLCGKKEDFGTLLELFSECRVVTNNKSKKDIESSGIVTVLSGILAEVSPVLVDKDGEGIDADLQAQLLHLCTKDGTPEQARHAVYTMAGLLNTSNVGKSSDDAEIFGPLLKALTSPSRMSVSGASSANIVSVIAALTALSDSAPSLFIDDDRGKKAIRFALDTILLGRRGSPDSGSDADEDEEEVQMDSSKSGRGVSKSPGRKAPNTPMNTTPKEKGHVLEDESLSIACRRACASIDFLVSFIRATMMRAIKDKKSGGKFGYPPLDQIEQIFDVLYQILQDKGLPPSSVDRRECKARQDRAALRECATVHLLRLCDARLQLEKRFFTDGMWLTLSGVLLDEEKSVRDGVIAELTDMLTGKGKYCQGGAPMAPSLRFLALIVFCADGDNNAGHSAANGNAANVGKRSHRAKTSALHCINSLRTTCDATLHQCRAMGKKAEESFETRLKMLLMPEYAVPYALHLLSLRRETPSAGGVAAGVPGLTQIHPSSTQEHDEKEDEYKVDDDAQQKILRKRLKWLFDPLVQSLGDGADNISFLLRITEVLGAHYQPTDIGVVGFRSNQSSQSDASADSSSISKATSPMSNRNVALSVAKLKTTCLAAREVLLRFVKSDANLSTYPGSIQLPAALFKKLSTSSSRLSPESEPSQSAAAHLPVERIATKDIRKAQASFSSQDSEYAIERPRRSLDSNDSSRSSKAHASDFSGKKTKWSLNKRSRGSAGNRVHFSPEVLARKFTDKNSTDGIELTTPVDDDDAVVEFGGMSPIASSSPSPTRSEKTAGTTPPSTLRTAQSSFEGNEEGSTDEDSKRAPTSSANSASPKRRSSRLNAFTQDSSQTTSETQVTVEERVLPRKSLPKTSNVARQTEVSVDTDEENEEESYAAPKTRNPPRAKKFINVNLSPEVASEIESEDEEYTAPKKRNAVKQTKASAKINKTKKLKLSPDDSDVECAEKKPIASKKRKPPTKYGGKTSIKVNVAKKQRLSQESTRGHGSQQKHVASPLTTEELDFDDNLDFNDGSDDDGDVVKENRKSRRKVPAKVSAKTSARKPFGVATNVGRGSSTKNAASLAAATKPKRGGGRSKTKA